MQHALTERELPGGPFERGQHVPLDAVALLVAQPEIDLRQAATIYAVGRNGGFNAAARQQRAINSDVCRAPLHARARTRQATWQQWQGCNGHGGTCN